MNMSRSHRSFLEISETDDRYQLSQCGALQPRETDRREFPDGVLLDGDVGCLVLKESLLT